MLTVRLTPELEKRLAKLSKRTGRAKSFYVKQALAEFLDEQEDYLIAMERLRENLPTIPLEEVMKRLGLEDQV